MDSITSIPGKLFFVVYEMYQDKTIDARGKLILKDLIILNAPQIQAAYDEYSSSGTELTLKSDLFRILKVEREAEKAEGLSDRSRKSKGLKNISIKVPAKDIPKMPSHIRSS